jgi:nucleoside-diphosphate-sugar epimerase
MSKKTILIAGGGGFLGSHLAAHFVENGDNVVVVDNFSTGRKANLVNLVGRPNYTIIEADITNSLPVDITNMKFDIIANLASPASPPHYQRLAIETLMVGSLGTQNLLDLARTNNARFFQASTSEVYGDPEVHPQPESYKGSVNSYGPRSMYDESKRYAEALIYAYREKYGISTGIIRIFNTYGPNMDPMDGRVVSNLIVQAIKNKPMTLYGDGNQTRSFCYVSDLINGFVRMIESDEEGPINLGNPNEFTIKQLAEEIVRLTGTTSKLVFEPLPGDDPMQRQPVIDKARKLLSWEPEVQLSEGLEKTIAYFRQTV